MTYSHHDHVHCKPTNSPCGHEGEHRCCLCGKGVKKSMEERIKNLGLQFRNLIQHSDGTWSCRIMKPLNYGHKKVDEFYGDSPEEVLEAACFHVDSFNE